MEIQGYNEWVTKYLILFFGALVVLLISIQITNLPAGRQVPKSQVPNNNQIPNYKVVFTSPSSFPSPKLRRGIKGEVKDFPFTVQAPTGEWGDPIFQDGCEEAAALMLHCGLQTADCRLQNGEIDKEWAREEIIKMSTGPADTSAKDTAERFFGDIKYQIVNLKSKEELKNGVWIVPMDGTKLGNPYYTAPGPERHMILVIGYDVKTDELITNDPGTKRGRGYRYKLDVFWNAIRDYPTGDHEPITEVNKNAILVMEPASE